MAKDFEDWNLVDRTGEYYPAYICKNTHEQIVNDNKFCPKCGEEVLSHCTSCSAMIKKGHIESEPMFRNPYEPEELTSVENHQIPFENFEVPNYCSECGKAFPWVEKFLKDYNTILELQSEEINKELQEKVFNATKEALKNKFEGPSLTILKLTLNKVSNTAKPLLMDVLSGIATSKITDFLK